MLTTTRCVGEALFRRFENLPEDLHGSDPAFAPPFPGSVRKFPLPDSHFHKQDGTISALLVERDGRLAVRIAAIHNRSAGAWLGDSAGYFGFFSCIDDPGVAAHLVGLAKAPGILVPQ